jgi:hypothetical protein
VRNNSEKYFMRGIAVIHAAIFAVIRTNGWPWCR